MTGLQAAHTIRCHGRVLRGLAAALLLAWGSPGVGAQKTVSDDQLAAIDFEQKLNVQVSRDLLFRDESGKGVRLDQFFSKKPVILVLGYYECPMLCTLVLNGMVESLQDLKWSIGDQFEVVTVSISPAEGPPLAAAKKRQYLKRYGRAGASDGWHFLTGEETSIRQLASQVGFHYVYDPASKQYAHPSGLVILTPDGKVAHYLFGVDFPARDLYSALAEARSKKIGSPIQKLILLCFHYNPITGKYGATIMLLVRIFAAATLVGLAWLVWSLARHQKTRRTGAMADDSSPRRLQCASPSVSVEQSAGAADRQLQKRQGQS